MLVQRRKVSFGSTFKLFISFSITLLVSFFFFLGSFLHATPLSEQFQQIGYVEIHDQKHGSIAFDTLYARFDKLIEFLQAHPVLQKKLHTAKERFIRSKNRNYYSTDVFGFYDESEIPGRSQISFYYSIHFHEFIRFHYPELMQMSQLALFFDACFEIQEPYGNLFEQTASALGLETLFSSDYEHPPLLLKVIKYLPSYVATRPHYDGSAFSLFLDSTDNQSLLLSPYQSSFLAEDFSSPLRMYSRFDAPHSILLIPGALLTEFSINPTPHVVVQSGNTRYATIAFAMRPNYILKKTQLSPLPLLIYK